MSVRGWVERVGRATLRSSAVEFSHLHIKGDGLARESLDENLHVELSVAEQGTAGEDG